MAQSRQFLTALCVPLFALALSACSPGARINPTSFVGASVPVALRSCSGEPARLEGDFTQRDVAAYIVRLRAAHADCSGNLAAVDQILNNYEQALLERAVDN